MKRLAAVLISSVIVIPVFAGVANARPTTNNNQGSAEHSNCEVTSVRNNGYLIEVRRVDSDGEVYWVKKRVKTLPTDVKFRVVRDYGVTQNVVCQYK